MTADREIRDLLQLAKETNWREALEVSLKKQKPLRYERITYEAAADWLYLLPLEKGAVVLDAGCGWGVLTFQLAQHYKTVVALDNSAASLEFIKIRTHQDNIHNIVPLFGNVLELPFPENHFDLVILNGVLEWVGLSDNTVDPEIVQKRLLKEVARVLKPEGHLYLGIENRWSATYFLGQKEGHVHLRFISLLPRKIARVYHRLIKKSDYRVYTHSLRQYLNMFRQTGYVNISTYSPLPQYQKFSHMIPLENINAVKFYVQKLFSHKKRSALFFNKIVKSLHLYKLMKYFVPCYSFIATRKSKDMAVELFLNRQWKTISGSLLSNHKQLSYILSSGQNRVLLFPFEKNDKSPPCVLKISRKQSKLHLQQKTKVDNYLKSLKSPLIEKSIPNLVYSGLIGNNDVLVEKVVNGTCLNNFIRKRGRPFWKPHAKKNVTIVLSWLTEFHKLSKNGELILESDTQERYFLPLFDTVKNDERMKLEKKHIISGIERLRKSVQGKRIPLVVQHRDFGPSNIFLNGNRVIVLDWEWTREKGEPLYDLYYFISRYFFEVYSDFNTYPIGNFETVGKFTEQIYFQGEGEMHNFISESVTKHCHSLGIDIDVAKVLFLWQEISKNKNFEVLNLFFNKEDKFII